MLQHTLSDDDATAELHGHDGMGCCHFINKQSITSVMSV